MVGEKCANPSCEQLAMPGYEICSDRCRHVVKMQRRRESFAAHGLCPQCGGELIPAPSFHKNKEHPQHCLNCQIYYRDQYELRTYGRKLTDIERAERAQLIGTRRVAEILSVNPATITYRMKQRLSGNGFHHFPAPVYFLTEKRPLWRISEIEDYKQNQ